MSVAVDKIKKYLKDNERTYAWLARQVGVKRQSIAYFMDKEIRPKDEIRKKLNEMFDLKDDWV